MTVQEAADIALEEIKRQLSPTSYPTWVSHAKHIVAYFKPDTELRTINRLKLQEWVDHMAQTTYEVNGEIRRLKTSTIKHYAALISRMWRVLEARGLDDGLPYPMTRVQFPRKNSEKRSIAPETVQKLATEMPGQEYEVVEFTAETCCRRLEVFRLRVDQVEIREHGLDQLGNKLYLGEAFLETSKTGKPRKVPLNWKAAAIVKRRVDEAMKTGAKFLFGSQVANRFTAALQWAKNVWRKSLKKMGQSGHFHGLRHYGARVAYANGASIQACSKMLGHSNIPQTEHYLDLKQDLAWEASFALSKGYQPNAAKPWAMFDEALPAPKPAAPPPPVRNPQPPQPLPKFAGFMLAGPQLVPMRI